MSAIPAIYRVYCFDGSTMTLTGDLIQATSDPEAIAKAQARDIGSRCEVWQADRLVAEIERERRLG